MGQAVAWTSISPIAAARVSGNAAVAATAACQELRAKCSSEFSLALGRATVEMRLLLDAETGNVETIDVAVSAESREPWDWHVESGDNQIRRIERLEAHRRDAAVLARGAAAGDGRAGRRLAGRGALAHNASAAAAPSGPVAAPRYAPARSRSRPLGSAVARRAEHGPHGGGSDPAFGRRQPRCPKIETQGLREALSPTSGPRGRAKAWRTYRYGEMPASLTLRGRSSGEHASSLIEEARLTTYVELDGSLKAYFQFRASHWPQRTLPVKLPPGSPGRWRR